MAALVPAALRAMSLFEVFAREKRPLTNSELARLLDLRESSCSDLVTTLLSGGYLLRTAKTKRVYPSGRLLAVAQDIEKSDSVLSAVIEACEMLRDATNESVLCGRVEDGVVRVIAIREGSHPLRYTAGSGDKLSLHVSALGKSILAFGPPDEVARQLRRKPLKKLASGTLTDLAELEAQINAFRRQGWTLVENEGGEGLAALAVAGMIGSESLAISIAGPVDRLRLYQQKYLEALQSVGAMLFGKTT